MNSSVHPSAWGQKPVSIFRILITRPKEHIDHEWLDMFQENRSILAIKWPIHSLGLGRIFTKNEWSSTGLWPKQLKANIFQIFLLPSHLSLRANFETNDSQLQRLWMQQPEFHIFRENCPILFSASLHSVQMLFWVLRDNSPILLRF